jgi:eukaryotic-like serine/threonine-protein kinase
MSPEQCAEESDLTGASDIYSLGAVGYFLLTGRPPFGGRSAMQMLAAHLYEVPLRIADVRSDVTEGLSDVLARCLEKLPTARYEDMEALERALLALVLPDSWTDDDARAWWTVHQPETEAAPIADVAQRLDLPT